MTVRLYFFLFNMFIQISYILYKTYAGTMFKQLRRLQYGMYIITQQFCDVIQQYYINIIEHSRLNDSGSQWLLHCIYIIDNHRDRTIELALLVCKERETIENNRKIEIKMTA